jgi:hypothetical protein
MGKGDGTFVPTTSPTVGTNPVGVVVGDFRGGGNLDLAIANYGSSTVSVLLNQK